MTTIDAHIEQGPRSDAASAGDSARASSGHALAGVAAWITTSDHKRLGRMMFGIGLLALLGTSVVSGLVTLERIDVDSTTLGSGSIDQLLSLGRVGLAFFAVLPIVLGLALAVVPLQLGARSLAFPRLCLLYTSPSPRDS